MLAQNPDYIVLRSESKRMRKWKYIYIYMQIFIGGILLKLLFRYRLNCYNMEMGFQHLKTEMNID